MGYFKFWHRLEDHLGWKTSSCLCFWRAHQELERKSEDVTMKWRKLLFFNRIKKKTTPQSARSAPTWEWWSNNQTVSHSEPLHMFRHVTAAIQPSHFHISRRADESADKSAFTAPLPWHMGAPVGGGDNKQKGIHKKQRHGGELSGCRGGGWLLGWGN